MDSINKYVVSINNPGRTVRIHKDNCNSRRVHENKKENQEHIENLTFEDAIKLLSKSKYEDKKFCQKCLKSLINYSHRYCTNFHEYDSESEYYIIEVKSKSFDEYLKKYSYFNECFFTWSDCTRKSSYLAILRQIVDNKNNQIAYPIISWINENEIKMSQGRHRTRAIIDSGIEYIRLAIKKEHLKNLKTKIDNVKIIKEFSVNELFKIKE